MNWGKIKRDYIAGKGSYRELAAKYNVPMKTLSTHARNEKWPQLRKQASDKAATKTVETVADANGRVQTRMQDAAEALMGKVVEGVLAADPEDARNLKAYSGVLRDLKEVLDLRTPLDVKEQEARIEKLRREAEKEREDRNREVVVTFGGADGWAE
nr:MAG TPA: Protein of unknown function (DUF1804) [Caudoviricetes sp.]